MKNPVNPDDWTDEDWLRHDAALARVSGPRADAFARALDLLGWMIVPQPHCTPGRWPMGNERDCPWWAEPIDPPDTPNPPTLRLIGGKDD